MMLKKYNANSKTAEDKTMQAGNKIAISVVDTISSREKDLALHELCENAANCPDIDCEQQHKKKRQRMSIFIELNSSQEKQSKAAAVF